MNGARAWLEKDFYTTLGVSEKASAEEIKRAYRRLARTHHPDRNPGDKAAEEKMKEISEAHGVLSDPKKRAEYDQIRTLGARGGFRFTPGAGARAGRIPFDLGDLFGNLFGSGFEARTGTPQRGPDHETEVRISFEDAARGVTTPVRTRRDVPCGRCNGTGDRSGAPQTCRTCGGSGSVGEDQGFFSFLRPCPSCGGRGRTITNPCGSCGGSGAETRSEEVRVRIPPGIADGARIRVRGRGAAGTGGGPGGDLYVRVRVGAHPLFGRRGANLTLTAPITFAEAALGGEITVPTLDGSVTVRIPPGTQSGRTFRVRGRGMARPKGEAGDLLVTVQVAVPERLSAEEGDLIRKLADAQRDSPRSHLGV